MNRTIARRIVFWTLMGAGAIYPFYSWISYTGLFRWFANTELSLQGDGPYKVDNKLLLLLVSLVSWGITGYLVVWWTRRRGMLPLGTPEVHASEPTWATSPKMSNATIGFLLVSSVATGAVGVGAGVTYYREHSKAVIFEPFVLADGPPPRSIHVRLRGLAVPSLAIHFNDYARGSHWETFTPVVAPGWRPGDSAQYFLKPLRDDPFQHGGPVMIERTGTLVRDGLPGAALFLFRKHGTKVGAPPMLLDADPHAELDGVMYVVIFCVIYAFVAFFIALAAFKGRGKADF